MSLNRRSHSFTFGERTVADRVLQFGTKKSVVAQIVESTHNRDSYHGFYLSDPNRVRIVYSYFGDALRPCDKSYSSVPHSVPLTRVASAPGRCLLQQQPEQPQEPTTDQPWKCRGCQSTDSALLVPNQDRSLVCDACGTVESIGIVALNRQKNCAHEDVTPTKSLNPRAPFNP